MDAHIRKVYVPMTETGVYILYCLQEEMHGYNIGLRVKVMTCGDVRNIIQDGEGWFDFFFEGRR